MSSSSTSTPGPNKTPSSVFSPSSQVYQTKSIIAQQQLKEKKSTSLFQKLITEAAKTAPSLSRRQFLLVLKEHGLLEDDERLSLVMDFIKSSDDDLKEPDIEQIRGSSNLVERALNGRLIIPDFVKFTHLLTKLYHETLPITTGKNADYIPQLAKVDPDQFGVAACTVDGQRFSIGDVAVSIFLGGGGWCFFTNEKCQSLEPFSSFYFYSY
jgi:hypothetical protein